MFYSISGMDKEVNLVEQNGVNGTPDPCKCCETYTCFWLELV